MDKKIAYETIMEVINDRCPQADTIDWFGTEITVQKIVPFKKVTEIVQRVTAACFAQEDGNYIPEVMNMALRICVFEAYTNIELPDDIDEQNLLLFGSGLWDLVTALINADQLGTIELAINRRVKARLDTNRAEFEHAVNMVVESIAELSQQMSGLMDGVTPEDIQTMISAIGENGIDEAKIVQAVVAEQNKTRDNVVEFPVASAEETPTEE